MNRQNVYEEKIFSIHVFMDKRIDKNGTKKQAEKKTPWTELWSLKMDLHLIGK